MSEDSDPIEHSFAEAERIKRMEPDIHRMMNQIFGAHQRTGWPASATNTPATDRVNALAFNALTKALSEADRFVMLSERIAIAAAVVAAVRSEIARQIETEIENTDDDSSANALLGAARIARGDG